MDSDNITVDVLVIISVFLVILLIIWVLTSLLSDNSEMYKNIGIIEHTYSKDVIIEQYSLLPEFLSGEYQCRFYVGAPHNLYPSSSQGGYIRRNNVQEGSFIEGYQDTFKVEIKPGIKIKYFMNRVSNNSNVFTVEYTVPYDIDKIDHIYLCDGVIVDNRKFIPNFSYRFSELFHRYSNCKDIFLTVSLNEYYSLVTDKLSCRLIPLSNTKPFSFSQYKNIWKGAWLGMKWTISTNDRKTSSSDSLILKDKDMNVLVVISDEKIKLSST